MTSLYDFDFRHRLIFVAVDITSSFVVHHRHESCVVVVLLRSNESNGDVTPLDSLLRCRLTLPLYVFVIRHFRTSRRSRASFDDVALSLLDNSFIGMDVFETLTAAGS